MRTEKEQELWSNFDTACGEAEAEFQAAVKLAERERDLTVSWPGNWNAHDRIVVVAKARCKRKKRAALAAREQKWKEAEGTLTKGLDQVEAEHRRLRGL
jgi:hypothetical protein